MDTQHFKQKLEDELKKVEAELNTVGAKGSDGDWEGKAPEMDTMSPIAEPNEAADKIEEFEANRGITDELEARKLELDAALARIEMGTYGTCRECGKEIEEERLEANPAATTCLAHV